MLVTVWYCTGYYTGYTPVNSTGIGECTPVDIGLVNGTLYLGRHSRGSQR